MKKRMVIVLSAAIVCVAVQGGMAAPSEDEEFAFASGLVNYTPSFPEFAQKVVDTLIMKNPSLKERARIVQAEILMKRRQFAEAEAIVNEMGMNNPKAQAISLSLGWNYFAANEIEKARVLYDAFFKLYEGKMPTDPDVKARYRDAAFRYAQMQEMVGDFLGASACYKRVEDVEASLTIKRSMMLSRAQMLVKASEQKQGDEKNKLLDEAMAVCKELQWGGLDLQFVDSLVVMANIELARGDREGAKKVLMTNMDIIKPIDETLKEMGLPLRDSPMAGTRSLLGRLLKEDADKIAGNAAKAAEAVQMYSQALGEFYNVFVKYRESTWGPSAGLQAKEIKEILERDFGKTVKIEFPEDIGGGNTDAAKAEFMMADNLFRQKKHEEAAAEYVRVLQMFPEMGELSIGAVGNLLQCYMNLSDDLYAKMAANYLGERFAKKSGIPAKGLVAVASLYDKAGKAEMSKYMFDRYLQYCPTDAQAGKILFWLASKAEQAGDKDAANEYLARIITDYQEDQNYPKALSKRAWKSYLEDKDYAGAIRGMAMYIKESPASPDKAQAMFALGDCLRRTGKMAEAVRMFDTLVKAISPEGNPYASSQADTARNQTLLEQARFYLAFSLSRLDRDVTRKASILKLDEFLKLYPQSALAAKALNLKGSLQMALKDDGANETFARLAREYPETDEGKNAQFARINGALDLGRFDQAKEALTAMLGNAGSYSLDEFARVGGAMLEKKQWTEAVQAYEQVAARESSMGDMEERARRALLERAFYGMGEAKYEMGDDEGAVDSLNELMNRWPMSAMFFKAKFILARASLKKNDTAAAGVALKDIFGRAREAELVNDAKLLYAEVLLQQKDDAPALAIYKGMEYFGSQDMKSEKERSQIETAILAAIRLAGDMGRPADVVESCDTYLKLYPTSPEVPAVRKARTTAGLQVESEAAQPVEAAPAATTP